MWVLAWVMGVGMGTSVGMYEVLWSRAKMYRYTLYFAGANFSIHILK